MTPKPKIVQLPGSFNYEDLVNYTRWAMETFPDNYRERKLARTLMDARLSDNKQIMRVVGNDDWGKRFDVLGATMLDGTPATMFSVIDTLKFDINHTRDWIHDWDLLVNLVNNGGTGHWGTDQLILMGQAILGRATELCPMETGRLRDSGVCVVQNDMVTIQFNCPYASYVHEDMSKMHKVGQAKFLEQAAQELLPNQTSWVNLHSEGVYINLGFDYKVTYGHFDS